MADEVGDTGHGFGLILGRRIVENHQGEIEAKSVVGQGTRLRIEFRL